MKKYCNPLIYTQNVLLIGNIHPVLNHHKMINDTTIRISKKTKTKLTQLPFVKKHTFGEIINYLIEYYEKNGKTK